MYIQCQADNKLTYKEGVVNAGAMEKNKVGKKEQKVRGGGKAVLNSLVLEGLTERLEQRLEEVEETHRVGVWNKRVPGRTTSKMLRCECA